MDNPYACDDAGAPRQGRPSPHSAANPEPRRPRKRGGYGGGSDGQRPNDPPMPDEPVDDGPGG